LREAGRRTDQSRLERAATVLGITVDEQSSFLELTPLVDRAIEALRRSLGLELAVQEDVIIDTANIVGVLYGSALVAEDTGKVQRAVENLVQARADPLKILIKEYEPYASPAPGVAGRGPALKAGVLTETEWQRVAGQLTVHVESVVRAIESFPA